MYNGLTCGHDRFTSLRWDAAKAAPLISTLVCTPSGKY
jgi:hypothetical protein